jgi:hypothetical protein
MTTPHTAKAPTKPYIAITLNDKRELVSFFIKDGPPFMSSDPPEYHYAAASLQVLADRGLLAASEGIGESILNIMRLWFPDEMAAYPELVPPFDFQRDLDLIQDLIGKSMRDKTSAHIMSIDAIIHQLKDNPVAASNASVITWLEVRNMLQQYPRDKF